MAAHEPKSKRNKRHVASKPEQEHLKHKHRYYDKQPKCNQQDKKNKAKYQDKGVSYNISKECAERIAEILFYRQ